MNRYIPMSKLIVILSSILFVGCNHSAQIKEQQLRDTIESIRKLSDYKPLNLNDAYYFINKCYLPRLDSEPTKRKIFIYAISGVDFQEMYRRKKAILEKIYSGDTIQKISRSNVYLAPPPPPPFFSKKTFKWDGKRLVNTKIITDTSRLKSYDSFAGHTEFRKKFGFGYMCISYPQYNSYTKRLVIRQLVEDGSFCGTGRDISLYFTKIPGGWIADVAY
ncbi:MAG: hypothetical protein JWP94_977 [Mucilaginibacter sp.]|jgi:hypothetical protein|nr:hypothetical protein [Mucilaginibacter sp.]